jgi:hypothetical protein
VTYLGEFRLDPHRPYYRMDAPETGGGPIRQVIVFRLLPIGDVVHDTQDVLQLPDDVAISDVEAAVERQEAIVRRIPVEEQHIEEVVVNPSRKEYTILRREQALVREYKSYLEAKGSVVSRFQIQPPGEAKPLRSDIYDETRRNIIEAKGTEIERRCAWPLGSFATMAVLQVTSS